MYAFHSILRAVYSDALQIWHTSGVQLYAINAGVQTAYPVTRYVKVLALRTPRTQNNKNQGYSHTHILHYMGVFVEALLRTSLFVIKQRY